MLPIHFFTIVLNGEPFIRYHLPRMLALPADVPWHWHIVEGLAELKHDTAWSVPYGATLPEQAAQDGRSIDGTAEYLDAIAREHPDRITVYRAPGGRNWDGKLEMVAAPLANVPDDALLWEIDSDELWTTPQFALLRRLFLENPSRTAAVFYCWYFVGPTLAINRRRRYPEIEWRRAWRYRKGMRWVAHEPPTLGVQVGSNWVDVAMQQPITPAEAERFGLVFQHFAYVTDAQLEFKEKYYGYGGILAQWMKLREQTLFPVQLRRFLDWPWVDPGAMVDPVDTCGIVPLAHVAGGRWVMGSPTTASQPAAGARKKEAQRGVLFAQRGAHNALVDRAIRSLRAVHPELPIHVETISDTGAFDKMRFLERSPFDETLFLEADTVVLDRLDFGFEMARKFGLACCFSECPWARRNGSVQGDPVEYDAGVLFYTGKARDVFEAWAQRDKLGGTFRIFDPRTASRALAAADHTHFSMVIAARALPPLILPSNWNFCPQSQPTWWGPIKVWHDAMDPPPGIVEFTRRQARPDAIIEYTRMG